MTHEWNKSYAEHTVDKAIRQASITATPSLVRIARTAVFKAGGKIVKLCPADHRPVEAVEAEARLTKVLHGKGLPVPLPVGEVFQIKDVAVAISEYIDNDPEQPINWHQLGLLVRELHSLPIADLGIKPSKNNDAQRYRTRINALLEKNLLDQQQADYLSGLIELAQDQVSAVSGELVLCHGDLQTGNILRKDDSMFLVDWEKAQVAPAAFDLSKMVGRVERYGLPHQDYNAFCRGYGATNLSELPGVRGLRNLSEVGGITYLLGSPEELHRQQAYLRLSDLMNNTRSIWRDY